MARKRKEEEHENHERWLVSYADFITLLFAFFVVMYAVSSVNDGKYRVLSDSLLSAFRDPNKSLDPIQIGKPTKSPLSATPSLRPPSGSPSQSSPDHGHHSSGTDPGKQNSGPANSGGPKEGAANADGGAPGAQANAGVVPTALPGSDAVAGSNGNLEDIKAIARKLGISLAPLIDKKLIAMRRDKQWIELEMRSNILFASGSARLEPQAIPVLEQLADSLRSFDNPIQVEGFTDNRPISTLEFPSNWELSAARAASVVHLFTRLGLRPGRMAAIGYGQYRPVASNDTPAGRQKNRRVLIVIAAKKRTGHIADVQPAAPENAPQPATPSADAGAAQAAAGNPKPKTAQHTPNPSQQSAEVASQ